LAAKLCKGAREKEISRAATIMKRAESGVVTRQQSSSLSSFEVAATCHGSSRRIQGGKRAALKWL